VLSFFAALDVAAINFAAINFAAINWDTYWLYLLTEAALSLSPGPAVMLVIAYGRTARGVRCLLRSAC